MVILYFKNVIEYYIHIYVIFGFIGTQLHYVAVCSLAWNVCFPALVSPELGLQLCATSPSHV
jgi:hypothetical protein